jgi:hypothetical protein
VGEDEEGTSGLHPLQTRALVELLTARTVEGAAERVGISERTLRRWLGREEFRKALRSEQRAVMVHVTTRLQQASVRAVDTLVDVMVDTNLSASARVGAARAVLDLARDGADLEWITERLEALEALDDQSRRSPGRLP